MFCPNCGASLAAESKSCPNCGNQVQASKSVSPASPSPALTTGISSDLKDLAPGEVVLMDTGMFPITYVKNFITSINGKLYLTSQRLVFKAGKLQGIGGVYAAGVFIPNPADANKAKQHFEIPLAQITAVKSGWANVTVQAGGQSYKFGGMRKTKEWEEAIRRALGR